LEKVIRLRSGRQGKLRPGHPWVYKNQFLKISPTIKPGDLISVQTSNGKFVGRGYYNPRSEISVRLLTFNDEPLDQIFFNNRIKQAFDRRNPLFSVTNAFRAVFSEADGLPGLIIDIYHNTVVFQVLTLGMDRFKNLILKSIENILKPSFVYEKSVSPFRKVEGLKDSAMWWGSSGEPIIEIFEGKAKFFVDIVNGHKTGFYLDQRKSRLALENFSNGKKVLDLFSYTGGFSVHAGLYGAKYVRSVDIKEEWLELGRKNAILNGVSRKIEFVRGDVFRVLKDISDSNEKFDLVIIDPPSFLKKKESLETASKGYKELNYLGMNILNEGGILATFSCSNKMPNEVFSKTVEEAALIAGKKFTILKRCHQAEDHPIVRSIPETEYLKGYFLKVSTVIHNVGQA